MTVLPSGRNRRRRKRKTKGLKLKSIGPWRKKRREGRKTRRGTRRTRRRKQAKSRSRRRARRTLRSGRIRARTALPVISLVCLWSRVRTVRSVLILRPVHPARGVRLQ
jgi:hypothetical protein